MFIINILFLKLFFFFLNFICYFCTFDFSVFDLLNNSSLIFDILKLISKFALFTSNFSTTSSIICLKNICSQFFFLILLIDIHNEYHLKKCLLDLYFLNYLFHLLIIKLIYRLNYLQYNEKIENLY